MSGSVNCAAQPHVRSLPGRGWSRESRAGPFVACDVKAPRRSRTNPRSCTWPSATRERVSSRSRRWSLAVHDRLWLITCVARAEKGSGGTSGKVGEARPRVARELRGRVLDTSSGCRAGQGPSAWFFRGCVHDFWYRSVAARAEMRPGPGRPGGPQQQP